MGITKFHFVLGAPDAWASIVAGRRPSVGDQFKPKHVPGTTITLHAPPHSQALTSHSLQVASPGSSGIGSYQSPGQMSPGQVFPWRPEVQGHPGLTHVHTSPEAFHCQTSPWQHMRTDSAAAAKNDPLKNPSDGQKLQVPVTKSKSAKVTFTLTDSESSRSSESGFCEHVSKPIINKPVESYASVCSHCMAEIKAEKGHSSTNKSSMSQSLTESHKGIHGERNRMEDEAFHKRESEQLEKPYHERPHSTSDPTNYEDSHSRRGQRGQGRGQGHYRGRGYDRDQRYDHGYSRDQGYNRERGNNDSYSRGQKYDRGRGHDHGYSRGQRYDRGRGHDYGYSRGQGYDRGRGHDYGYSRDQGYDRGRGQRFNRGKDYSNYRDRGYSDYYQGRNVHHNRGRGRENNDFHVSYSEPQTYGQDPAVGRNTNMRRTVSAQERSCSENLHDDSIYRQTSREKHDWTETSSNSDLSDNTQKFAELTLNDKTKEKQAKERTSSDVSDKTSDTLFHSPSNESNQSNQSLSSNSGEWCSVTKKSSKKKGYTDSPDNYRQRDQYPGDRYRDRGYSHSSRHYDRRGRGRGNRFYETRERDQQRYERGFDRNERPS